MLCEFEKTDNIALLFGAGYLDMQYADKILGRQYLDEFLSRAADEPIKYKLLVNQAKKILQ